MRAAARPALRAMSFAERGAMLGRWRKRSRRTATSSSTSRWRTRQHPVGRQVRRRRPVATLLAYAELGASLVRRGSWSTAKASSSAARALSRPARVRAGTGVAVHINAFNFRRGLRREGRRRCSPGCRCSASRPPARQWSPTHHGDRREAKMLPEGALSLLVGSPRDFQRCSARRTCSPSPARATPARASAHCRTSFARRCG